MNNTLRIRDLLTASGELIREELEARDLDTITEAEARAALMQIEIHRDNITAHLKATS